MSDVTIVSSVSDTVLINTQITHGPTIITSVSSGARGRSAYEVWLNEGNQGTVEDYLNSLKGEGLPPTANDGDFARKDSTAEQGWVSISTADVRDLIDKHYRHEQMNAAMIWTITHNLNKYPSVTIFNTFNMEVIGEVSHVSPNQLTITFTSPFSGVAYLN